MVSLSDRDELVLGHLDIPRIEAFRFMPVDRPTGTGLARDDLIALGLEALIAAAARFDPGRGVKFGSYACHRVRGAIKDGLRAAGWGGNGRHHPENYDRPVSVEVLQESGWDAGDGGRGERDVELLLDVDAVDRAMEGLPVRQQLVLRLYYWEGWKLQRIGLLFGVGEARACQIHRAALSALAPALEAS